MTDNVLVYLYVEGFDEHPSHVCQKMGVSPSNTYEKGVIAPGGKNPSKWNFFEITSSLGDTDDLNDHVENILSQIPCVKTFKQELPPRAKIGINAVIYLQEHTSPCALYLDNPTLTKVTALGCKIAFDVYG